MGLATRREFAEVWGARLADWLEIGGGEERGPALAATVRARDALVQAIVEGVSLPGIARRVVFGQQAKGEWSAGWLERIGDAQDRAEYAGRTLLGMRIGCARCHDHPSDRWRQSEHLAFSACFASPRPDGHGGMMRCLLTGATAMIRRDASNETCNPAEPALNDAACHEDLFSRVLIITSTGLHHFPTWTRG